MANFKPQVSYITHQSLHSYWNASSYSNPSKTITKRYNTYRELKKDLKKICEFNIDDDGVFVVRSKRGNWGEWFERWKIVNGKPTIVKQGWC